MTSKKKNVELKRVNMNLPLDLVQKVIKYGEDNGLNTTSAYIVLLNQALNQVETINNLPTILDMLKYQMLENVQEKNQENSTKSSLS